MFRFYLVLLLPVILFSLEYKGNIGFISDHFIHNQQNKKNNSLSFKLELELEKQIDNHELALKLKNILDESDPNRRYTNFIDLYYKYNFENSEFLIGKNSIFWGSLEVNNITDVFSTKDILDDPFDYESKLGSWSTTYTRFFEDSELSLLVKLHEEKQKIQSSNSVFNNLPLPYDDTPIAQASIYRPSIFIKYDGFYEYLDYAFIYQNGYDNQRYLSAQNGEFRQNIYLVNKFLSYFTLISGDTIYKTELAYTISDDDNISDYLQMGVGVEHTLYGIWEQKDLGFLAEYYSYIQNHNKPLDAKALNQIFDNDLYIGLRLSINDAASSELLTGIDVDLNNQEQTIFFSYDTRVFDAYKLKLTAQHIAPSQNSILNTLTRIKLDFSYYF